MLLRNKKMFVFLSVAIIIFVTSTSAYAAEVNGFVVRTPQGDLQVDLSEYALAFATKDSLYDFLRGGSQNPEVRAVVSGGSFYNLADYAVNFAVSGSAAGALENTTPLSRGQVAEFRRLESFNLATGTPEIVDIDFANDGTEFNVVDIY